MFEFVVLEGADVGEQFTLDAPVIEISRGAARAGRRDAILLREPTVSARQATIRATPDGLVIEHRSEAENATQVNGRRIDRQKLEEGDQIRMGRALLQLRARDGVAFNSLFEAPTRSEDQAAPEQPVAIATEVWEVSGTTEVQPTGGPYWSLRVVSTGAEERQFPIRAFQTTIGRTREGHHSDIAFPKTFKGISRRHARVEWNGTQLVIVHMSRTNSTVVNGVALIEPEEKRVLNEGDEIQLPDGVTLLVEAVQSGQAETAPALGRKLDELSKLEREIEEQFKRSGSFLDVDVAGSSVMKSGSENPHHVYLSFERWRAFVGRTVEEFDGMVLNSNGDELMCFFESTYQAVKSASEILKRLDEFNSEENLLASSFHLRIGVHSGHCLVDLEAGKAFSAVLDTAGHLQKEAPVDGLLISDDVRRELPKGNPFEPAGGLKRDSLPVYRLVGWVE
ncbi:MAG: FHA domain-containing protein [Myxococcota bacterium]